MPNLKVPWGVIGFFFAGLAFMGVYWWTHSNAWFIIAGSLWATVGGSYLYRVYGKRR